MNLNSILMVIGVLVFSNVLSAQVVSADSINTLSNNNKMLKIAISINDKKLELAKYQNERVQKNYEVTSSANTSLVAANTNQDAATILLNDDQDKAKAKTAKKSARKAEKSAFKARKAQDNLVDHVNEIEKLKNEIADEEQKLKALGGSKYLNL